MTLCHLFVAMKKIKNKIKEELSKKLVSVIFDGTTWLGEAFTIVLHFVSKLCRGW